MIEYEDVPCRRRPQPVARPASGLQIGWVSRILSATAVRATDRRGTEDSAATTNLTGETGYRHTTER